MCGKKDEMHGTHQRLSLKKEVQRGLINSAQSQMPWEVLLLRAINGAQG
jgi:hypothetical protein